ncbi:MAG: GtrA family protein [Methylotenera sp.]|jgi:putative flippase GtrA|uniref:GtrA family protein n=1 Tax=Methylotenera sp. TaxID=2051956 RepID=UPI00271E7164|nr:GtrA family protein [Methylotenera sp.]MDO9150341.1 GtrA family protein [Methylotenera sp.]
MTPKHRHSVSWFVVIGALAAGVHYVVAVSLELTHVLNPIYANTAGFVFAFPVSYFGHRKLSFSGQDSSNKHAFPRFFIVALAGFLANQLLVSNAIYFTSIPFWLVLGVVMVIVAVSTYFLSRYWAFKGMR